MISVLSLVDQIVDRVLFGPWARAEVANHFDIAGKTGWSPLPANYLPLIRTFDSDVLATDCSAFDWTFPAWLVDNILETRIARMRAVSEDIEMAMRARWREVLSTDCVMRLPDGSRLRQMVPGVMKSGWLLTISVNSEAQERLAIAAWHRTASSPVPTLWSMGDDVLMSWPEDGREEAFLDELRSLGVIVKQASHNLEFAGFAFGAEPQPYAEPIYGPKHRFLLRHVAEEQLEEVVSAYGLLYSMARPETSAWVRDTIRRYGRWTLDTCRSWGLGHLSRQTRMLTTADAHGWLAF